MIVLDTEVLAELLKPEPDPTVMAWLAVQRRGELYTTTVSEAEVAAALASLPKGRRRDALGQAVARLLGEGLGGRILPFDRAAAAAYGDLTPKRQAAGEAVTTAVGQVAAIAKARGARLVATREAAGYLAQGVKCVDPWAN
ncbi:type II toxin-antitoxin system VapC family toxin [Lichenibacterium dinghuense]|uniref:type II toxin-antitoxin system VapC family toxin n=1 Tax=Lichenibacterium dinghuense TaxID=2895977 RepID=UPI001F2C9530|nr:type II toxin-antitoxin system VapC family toxin [Lichenibacterium sp. 6Y81]